MPASKTNTTRERWVPTLTISVLIAHLEIRRRLRKLRAQDVWLALMALSAIAIVVTLPLLYGITRDWGSAFATGDTSATATVTLALAATWLLLTVFAIVSAVGSYGEIDNEAGVLTVRPAKDVAGGLLLSAIAYYLPFVVVPFGAGYLGLAVGTGTPLPFVGGLVATTVTLVTACAVGYPIGLACKGLIRRSEHLSRLKPVLGVVAAVAYFWIMFSGRFVTLVEAIEPALLDSPLGLLGDLALLTTPGAGASTANALLALLLAGIVLPIATVGTVGAARYAWYVDRVRDSDDETDEADDSTQSSTARLDAILAPFCRRPGTLGVASTALVRAYRAPLQLVFVVGPLLGVLPFLEEFVRTGTAPEYAPWLIVCYGAWAAGTAFPLNLLGNQGLVLPTVLTARSDGRHVVHGSILAASLTLGPLTAIAAVGVGHVAGRPIGDLLSIAVVALGTVVAGAVVAAGFGALFPRFRSIDFSGTRSAVPPSKAAFSLFSMMVALSIYTIAILSDELIRGLASAVLSDRLPIDRTVSPAELETAAWFVAPLLVLAVPVAYAIAVRRVERYTIA